MLSRQLESASAADFLRSRECSRSDALRILSCKTRASSLWLEPCPSLPNMSDFEAEVAVRYRLGLPPPGQALPRCPLCNRDTSADLWHCLACEGTRRKSVTRVHDKVATAVCSFARQRGCVASVSFDSGGLTPDGQVHTVEATWLFDVSGVHILAPSHLRSATPGSAVTARVTTKHLKCDSHATGRECKFDNP